MENTINKLDKVLSIVGFLLTIYLILNYWNDGFSAQIILSLFLFLDYQSITRSFGLFKNNAKKK